jgi:hypothetical protein
MTPPDWLAEIPARPFIEAGVEMHLPLPPGDRALVQAGADVAPGDPLVEHLRDPRIDEVEIHLPAGTPGPVAGTRWSPPVATGRFARGRSDIEGEVLAPVAGQRGRWRIVAGEHRVVVTSPVAGRVVDVRPGAEVRIRADGPALRGVLATGAAARGRLELATDPFGELRPGGIDVSRAGCIVVVGSRIDAEALTRARAMGVRGIVVATLPGKELRDFAASEYRQRAALHPAPPFGVLVTEGAIRRPIPSPVAALLAALAGREVALLVDPPVLVFEAPDVDLPVIAPDWVRVRSGPNAGAEGRVIGLAGRRRFDAGAVLEAAWVELEGEPPVAFPIGDLERFA